MTLEKLWVNIGLYLKEKVDMVYVGGICNDKEQLNLIKRVSTRDSVLFVYPFQHYWMLVVSALQNTAYTGNYCLVLMNEKRESMTVEVMLFLF